MSTEYKLTEGRRRVLGRVFWVKVGEMGGILNVRRRRAYEGTGCGGVVKIKLQK